MPSRAGAQAPQEIGTGWDAERIERKNPWDLGQPRGDLRKIPEEGLSAAALGEFFSKPKGPRSRAAIGEERKMMPSGFLSC